MNAGGLGNALQFYKQLVDYFSARDHTYIAVGQLALVVCSTKRRLRRDRVSEKRF
jgi:hypothetical protein